MFCCHGVAGAVDDLTKSIELVEAMNFKVFPEPGVLHFFDSLGRALFAGLANEASGHLSCGGFSVPWQVGSQFAGDARKNLVISMLRWKTTLRPSRSSLPRELLGPTWA